MKERNLPAFGRTTAALTLAVSLAFTGAVIAETPNPKAALSLRPVQTGIEIELVAPADVDDCEVKDINHPKWTGWEVIAKDGTLLRRFADTNEDKKVDLWCYFNFGIAVYRDVDADFNGKADQYQWLGTAGTRWGLDDNEDGTIDRWKRISVEEVSAEVVAALSQQDPQRFSRLLATEAELTGAGVGESRAASLASKADRAARGFADLAKRQKAVGSTAKWVQFASSPPGIVPAGTDGSTSDLVVYENAVAMFEQGERSGQLMVGTVIKVGTAWRIIDLPSVGDDSDTLSQAAGNFFTPGNAAMASAANNAIGDETQEMVLALEKIDAALATATNAKEVARLHDQRADAVESLIAAASTQAERETWVRQLVDTVTVAIQSGSYPDGLERMRGVARKFAKGNQPLAAYADFQTISTDYVIRQGKGANFAKVQDWYLKTLNDFIDRYPRTQEAAQAMLQLALSKEFEDKDSEALKNYRRVARDFPNTNAGEKAAGAVRRLDSEGKRIEFTGATIDGRKFDLSNLRGKPVIIHYWATWCEPCKQEMNLLRRLQARYKGLQLVGVNVDASRDLAIDYLKEKSLTWVQLFEDGGLESSPLSKQFGVQTLPTMMLIDSAGRVVRHNVRAGELDTELEKMTK